MRHVLSLSEILGPPQERGYLVVHLFLLSLGCTHLHLDLGWEFKNSSCSFPFPPPPPSHQNIQLFSQSDVAFKQILLQGTQMTLQQEYQKLRYLLEIEDSTTWGGKHTN